MKSYEILAEFYDTLILDEEGIQKWIAYTKRHAHGSNLLELACGSGAMTTLFCKEGYEVTAGDLSLSMLEKAKEKLQGYTVNLLPLDMRAFTVEETFSTVVCYNDSINYLKDEQELAACFHCVYQALKPEGVFLFDVHTTERLAEFSAEEYIEEGILPDQTPYQWTIDSEENRIYHHLTFWYQDQVLEEVHEQTVFSKETVKRLLTEAGFLVTVTTDFTLSEDTPGEKWFFQASKH